ncbi:MAG: hypothetical protein AAFY08_06345 [Planctomycetota bacterium]
MDNSPTEPDPTPSPAPASIPPTSPVGASEQDTMGLVSVILSSVGLVGAFSGCLCLPVGLLGLMCPAGAITGWLARRKRPDSPLGLIGFIIGLVGTLLVLLLLILAAIGITAAVLDAQQSGSSSPTPWAP